MSIDSKKKNVSVCYIYSRKTPDAAVVLSVKVAGGACCLKNLQSNTKCSVGCKNCYRAAMAYSVYECARDKVMGSPLDISRAKVSNISCGSLGEEFVICWNTQPTFSAVRKSLTLATSCLVPGKLYSKYADNIKMLGLKADRAEFGKLSNDFLNALKKSISVAVVGKVKLDNKKVQLLADKVAEKFVSQKAESPAKPPSAGSMGESEWPCWSASGLGAALAAEYIQTKAGGMGVAIVGPKICVYSKSWESKRNQITSGSRVKDYVDQKFKKLGKDLGGVLAYVVATQCHGTASTVKAASKISVGDVASKIKGSLK